MQSQSELSFYAKEAGKVKVTIIDISGKVILKTSDNLLKGIQKYRISGISQGIYFAIVNGSNYNYTAKIVCVANNHVESSIEIKNDDQFTDIKAVKNNKNTVNMSYNIGDRLLLKGISGNYSTLVTDIPSNNKTIVFNFESCTDYDNNKYTIVEIGTQTWMAENLKTTHYQNGDSILNITSGYQWSNSVYGAYCCYNNSYSYSEVYGLLYNYYAISDSSNLCPSGWHVPSSTEFTNLINYLDGEYIAGRKLKKADTLFWQNPNIATNETGFSALPGGMRGYLNGQFYNIGYLGLWWTSELRLIDMTNNSSEAINSIGNQNFGASVRCIKN